MNEKFINELEEFVNKYNSANGKEIDFFIDEDAILIYDNSKEDKFDKLVTEGRKIENTALKNFRVSGFI